jgi:SSS family solute:Na+ symporter
VLDGLRSVWFHHPEWVTWFVVAGYVAFIVSKGIAKTKKIQSTDDFLLASRNVGFFLLFCTMGATIIGGGASIGAVGKTYDMGIVMLLVSMGWYVHLIVSGLFVAPRFREARLYTVAGYFGHRFGAAPRFLALLLSLFFSVFIVAAQMAAFGWVLASLMPRLSEWLGGASSGGLGLKAAIIVGGLLVVAYSTAGGLLAVIYTDVYQFIVLFAGFVVTLVLIAPDLFSHFGEVVAAAPPGFFEPTGGRGWLYLLTAFLAFLLGESFAPGYATRYCVGKSIRETKLGIAGVGFFLALTFPIILFFIAAFARWRFPNIDGQAALPMVVRRINHPLVSGLMIGALLSAVMSSADSALNSATAIFVKDLFEHQLGWRDRGDGRTLRLARLCTFLLGVAAILVAVASPDIIGLLLITYHVWAPAVVVPVLYGAFFKASGPLVARQVAITMVVSTVATLVFDHTRFASALEPAVFGVLVSVVLLAGMRNFWKAPRPDDRGEPSPSAS